MKYNSKIVLAFFKEHGLPEPQLEYVFAPPRKFRFDFAWLSGQYPLLGIALEVEGGLWSGGAHARPAGIIRDIEKGNLAVLNGWGVLRVQPKDLLTLATVNMIKEALR